MGTTVQSVRKDEPSMREAPDAFQKRPGPSYV